jgi:Kdo2-lipid IVA lauroyltransferase/acyltransferase
MTPDQTNQKRGFIAEFAATTRARLDEAVYLGVRAALAGVGALPFEGTVAAARALGIAYGGLPINRKRLARALSNLGVAFPDWEQEQIRRTALDCYGHLFVLGTELISAPRILADDTWSRHLQIGDIAPVARSLIQAGPCILITGHCGNWELMGYTVALLGFPLHALYRPLDLAPMDRWVRGTRARRGVTLIDKFGALRQLPELMAQGAPVGVVADQNGGDRGVFVPFFNRLASTYKSIGLLAMQFNATVACGGARRVPMEQRLDRRGLGYQIELTDTFGPADWAGHPDPLFYLTARYRRAIELQVRRAPEQYLWMHRIWRSRPRHERMNRPFPESLADKLRSLPWLTETDIETIKEHSRRDARTLQETGQDKLS